MFLFCPWYLSDRFAQTSVIRGGISNGPVDTGKRRLTRTLACGSEGSGGRLRPGVGLRLDVRLQRRLGSHIRRGSSSDPIEGPVSDQLHAIINDEPDQGVAPYKQRPPPAERRH